MTINKTWAERIGVDITALLAGTQILIDTEDFAYNIEIEQEGVITIDGGIFKQPTQVVFIGSKWGNAKVIKGGWIGKGMCMVFHYKGNPKCNKKSKFVSTPITGARVYAPDKSWSLELWEE